MKSAVRINWLLLVALLTAATFPSPIAPNVSPLQQLFLLKELKPDLERVGIIWKKDSPNHDALMPKINQASAATGVQVVVGYVGNVSEVAPQFRNLKREHDIQALWIIEEDGIVDADLARDFLIKNATKDGLLMLAPSKPWVNAGACMTFESRDDVIHIVLNKTVAELMSVTIPEKYAERTQYLALN